MARLITGLGRHVEHDPASWDYEHDARRMMKRFSVTYDLRTPALDQGSLGACTGFAAAQWLNCAANIKARVAWNNALGKQPRAYCTGEDAVRLYSHATRTDDIPGVYPPEDTGSSGLGVAKVLKKFGAITRYEWTFDFPSLLSTLQTRPVLIGVNWYESMCWPDKNFNLHIDGENIGGHEVLARGIDVQRGRVRIRNNWGPNWGYQGDAFIPTPVLRRLIIDEQGDVVVPIR